MAPFNPLSDRLVNDDQSANWCSGDLGSTWCERFPLQAEINGLQEAEWLYLALLWTLYDLYHVLDEGVKAVASVTQTGAAYACSGRCDNWLTLSKVFTLLTIQLTARQEAVADDSPPRADGRPVPVGRSSGCS